jgi:ribosome biogenesis GTPase
MTEHIGMVTRGINNIYTVVPTEHPQGLEGSVLCRIKGKVLQSVEDSYNPLAVGDRVIYSSDGMILRRLERENSFERWNGKRQVNQTLVANMDLVLLITSTDDPPFRPRFIDRAIVCAGKTNVMIVLNKCDLPLTEDEEERFRLYGKLGYPIFAMSAFDEPGVQALVRSLRGKTVALIGQSGVGKSTITNALLGSGPCQRTGTISSKFRRGRHTTNHALMLEGDGFLVVDTPGMRELQVPHEDPHLIAESFPEFRKASSECSFQPCLHDHEPGCAVKALVEKQVIHHDRYESYLRMLASLDERPESWENDRR